MCENFAVPRTNILCQHNACPGKDQMEAWTGLLTVCSGDNGIKVIVVKLQSLIILTNVSACFSLIAVA